ncbi:MAG: 23S rRNA pseudouridine(1911/1915/1917) synthase RluD [Gammaproteobacteria bacterium]|nr:23S rRNA pseudouridine(1911/1915/1917) synthase RluD [Gammaproteobacteria bacterium]MBU1723294.1 23S rRNA pseudouridine(1911/1915/1917) synthase RluD [Gammaproteobacteria bacterium]MBU2006589.1 23S rRNA pseudouridine(1911/1915/1917) synthase RluD [Gammaproteobacteria bacterium]
MLQNQQIVSTVPPEMDGQRLDQVVASLCPQYSRSQLQKWIKAGHILVDDKVLKPKDRLTGGEAIIINAVHEVQTEFEPESIELDIVYEDDAIMVINKPTGLVVHPAAGNWSGTLVNALLHHNPSLEMLPRAGIVHRLDKETTGLMVVAKTLEAHTKLVALLQDRDVSREYLALVFGKVVAGSTIEANIGRHHVDRKKQAVTDSGKEAITHYRVEERFPHHTLLRVSLETGRTHQIRVHLSWKHMPIVGDPTYGGRPRVPAGISDELREALQSFPRQALHATKLGLVHPESGEYMEWEVPVPEDMVELLDSLRKEAA